MVAGTAAAFDNGPGITFVDQSFTNTGQTATVPVSVPTRTKVGDFELMFIGAATSNSNAGLTAPDRSFVRLAEDTSGLEFDVWYHIATVTEPTSWDFTCNVIPCNFGYSVTVVYRGVSRTSPAEAVAVSDFTLSPSTVEAPGLTLSKKGLVVIGFDVNDADRFYPVNGTTQRAFESVEVSEFSAKAGTVAAQVSGDGPYQSVFGGEGWRSASVALRPADTRE
jgi:hypothetical protein